jgi:16S rRNA (uracil1498-N3)-methyltransferase
MRLFYDPHITIGVVTHVLSEEESKHIIRVLRMSTGDHIGILDGKGSLFTGEITHPNPKKCEVKIIATSTEDQPKYSIHIALAPTKQNERIEWFVEKATEIGVTEISLLNCKNSERVKSNKDRFMKKAVSAMKQSNRKFLPVINELTDFESFVKSHPNGLIAHCYDEEKNILSEVFQLLDCPIIIGPEGDFTLTEVELASKNGYKTITLGENRLRTETAALYACMHAKIITEGL